MIHVSHLQRHRLGIKDKQRREPKSRLEKETSEKPAITDYNLTMIVGEQNARIIHRDIKSDLIRQDFLSYVPRPRGNQWYIDSHLSA